jgi:WhiB family redox-sensing transcriptional regulator
MRKTHSPAPDARFPFPATGTRTPCQTNPGAFDYTIGDRSGDRAAAEQKLEKAGQACAGCPVAEACLLWALVNADATRSGIFAGTTPRQRTTLRKRLADRLGPDWIDVLAEREQARRDRAAAARHAPLTVAQSRIVRLDREINGPMRQPTSTRQQQRNRRRLVLALRSTAETRTLAHAG